jgi:histone H3/H4
MAQALVVSSKIKALAKVGGLRTSAEFIEALSEKVGLIVIEAAKKAKADKRGTIKARDLPEISFAE